MREAELQDLGYSIGGRNISNARNADDAALIAESPMEMQHHKVTTCNCHTRKVKRNIASAGQDRARILGTM